MPIKGLTDLIKEERLEDRFFKERLEKKEGRGDTIENKKISREIGGHMIRKIKVPFLYPVKLVGLKGHSSTKDGTVVVVSKLRTAVRRHMTVKEALCTCYLMMFCLK